MRPQSVLPRNTRPTHCAALRMASNPRNSDSRIRYASRRYSNLAFRIRLSVYWYGTLTKTQHKWTNEMPAHLPKHKHGSSIIVVKINSFRNFSSRHRQEHCSSTVVTGLDFMVVSISKRKSDHNLRDDNSLEQCWSRLRLEFRQKSTCFSKLHLKSPMIGYG